VRASRKNSRAIIRTGKTSFYDCGGPAGVLIASAENPDLKQFGGKTLDDVAKAWKKSPEDTLMDFVIADKAQTGAIYFMASEEDLRTGLNQPWTSIGLDAGEMSLDGPLYEPHTHPRAMGSMPRFLGRYVRGEHLLSLESAFARSLLCPPSANTSKPWAPQVWLLRRHHHLRPSDHHRPCRLHEARPALRGHRLHNREWAGRIRSRKLTGAMAGRVLRGRGWQPSTN